MQVSLGFGIFTVIAAWHIDFAPRMQSRLQLEMRDAARSAETEALDRVAAEPETGNGG